jgi:hypothetical protein
MSTEARAKGPSKAPRKDRKMQTFTSNEIAVLNQIIGHQYSTGNGDLAPYFEMVKTGDFSDLSGESMTYWWPDDVAADLGWSGQKLGGVVASLLEKGALGIHFVKANERRNGDDDTVWVTSPDAVIAWASWREEQQEEVQEEVPTAGTAYDVLEALVREEHAEEGMWIVMGNSDPITMTVLRIRVDHFIEIKNAGFISVVCGNSGHYKIKISKRGMYGLSIIREACRK